MVFLGLFYMSRRLITQPLALLDPLRFILARLIS